MTILPFQPSDVVVWLGEAATVTEVRGDRIVVRTADGMPHITSEEILRGMQPVLLSRAGGKLA